VLIALDAIGAASAAGVLQAAIKGALSGDTRAQELILSRVWPARRDRPVSLVLPPIATAGDVMQAMAAVTSAIAAGQVTPGEGQAISTVLAAARQAIETTELADRISRLEAAQPHDEGRDP
jgi:capsular polysaccharide biosynthesis protein